VNDYVVEGTPECPWRDEKTIIRIKAYLFKEPPEGPRRDEKNNGQQITQLVPSSLI
jgi:hypothetical protein|tara:strand:- start:707 stop:874 length:168 start_codon:yes stop_codon:yes gene_type:complete